MFTYKNSYEKIDNLNDELIIFEQKPIKKRKFIILGPNFVGKTSIIIRFIENIFIEIYEPTIQNFYKKNFFFNKNIYEIEIIDLNGLTEYSIFTINKVWMGLHGIFLVYSIDDFNSFSLIKKINEKVNSTFGKSLPRILIGNKSDSKDRKVSYENGLKYSKEINCPFLETSCKNNCNIKLSFEKLIKELNKKEAGFNENKYKCLSIYKCFNNNLKCFRIIYFLFMIFNIILSLFFFILSFYFLVINKEEKTVDFTDTFPLIIISLLVLIINILGLIGICKKSYEYFYVVLFGMILNMIFIIITSIIFIKIKEIEENVFKFIYIFIFPILLLFYFVIIIFTFIFITIYKDELENFLN